MVSRRKILSRSRDDLNLDQTFVPQEEEEDIWYQKDKLFKEHIQEVLEKWTQIDDEIWAKVIVFEKNRRVAKAYARAPVLTINGSDDGFDGMRIGLCGFDNPMRDQKTDEVKRHIGQGVKIKMDDAGNILIRRYAKSNVYIKSTASSPNEETAIGAEILKLPNQALESEKIVKLFDMKKFQSNVNRELRRAYPDRRRLETQCLSAVAFVKSDNDILDCPVWVLIVNVVAMDMLKSKLPPVQRPMVDIKNRPRIPIPDEDPYSVAGNSGGSSGSSGFGANGVAPTSSGHVAATREQLLLQTQQLAARRSEKPPKLPPRDIYGHDIPKPDYDDIEVDSQLKTFSRSSKSDKGKDNKKYDDPYYCGLRARVPNFVKSKSGKEKDTQNGTLLSQKKTSIAHMQSAPIHGMHPIYQHPHILAAHHQHQQHLQQQQHQQQQLMWHARSYESGIGIYSQLNYMLEPHHEHHYGCTTATANGGGVACPYEIYGHTKNLTTADMNPNWTGIARLPRLHKTCYRTCSMDCYVPPTTTTNLPYSNNNNNNNTIYGYCGVKTNNKWRSESDIVNIESDDQPIGVTINEEKPNDNDSEHDSPRDSRNSSPLVSSATPTSNTPGRMSKPSKHVHTKTSSTKNPKSSSEQKSPNVTTSQLESFPCKKSASIESFFQIDTNQPKNNDDIYDRVKSGDEIYINQRKRIEDHLRTVAEKDNKRERFLLRNASSFSAYSQSESAYQPIPRIYERPSRNAERKFSNMRRERSMYDYRGKDSDMESIYGYLKPRKTRGHGLKAIAK